MNSNAYEVSIYMIIHILILLLKNLISNILKKIYNFNKSKNDKNTLEIMKQKLNYLNEQINDISPFNEYPKYTKTERQINKLNIDIDQIEKKSNLKNIDYSKDSKRINSLLRNYWNKIFEFIIIIFIEYILLKNKYLEVDYKYNKNNIVANHYYNENDNKIYVLIPVHIILLYETLVLNSISCIINKLI